MEKVLEIKDLHVHFPTYQGVAKVLNGVNLTIEPETITGLVGETGSGKSMTGLSILRLIKRPGRIVKGSIFMEDKDLVKLSETEMKEKIRGKKISLIPQGTRGGLNPTFTVGEQISVIFRIHQKLNKRQSLEKAEEMLRKVGIPEPKKRLKAYPHELSGGMCQRVMIAIGLACNPRLLIADEPTTGLDVTVEAQILELIQNLISQNKLSCILITHDLGVVAEVCQNIAVMYGGQVLEFGKTADVFEEPLHPYTQKLLKATLRVDQHKPIYSIPGSVPDLLNLPQGCNFAPRCDKKLKICDVREPEATIMPSGRIVKCFRAGDI